MELFKEYQDLRVGKILEVSGTAIRVELDAQVGDLTRIINGRVYPIGQMASIVKIHYGRKILFAYVQLLRMKSEIIMENQERIIAPGDDSRILEADLFAQGAWDCKNNFLLFTRGVETYPLPLQAVYLMTVNELEALYKSAEFGLDKNSVSPLINIGEYVGGNGAKCHADMNKMFGLHCAILGSTGSGKSGTVAALLHAVIQHSDQNLHPRIIVIDPHGEYKSAFTGCADILRAYSSAANIDEGSAELKLPYWIMSGDELRELIIGKTEAEATSQNNIIYKALKHARMVSKKIIKQLSDNPDGNESPNLISGKTPEEIDQFDRDKPFQFSLNEFIKHIDKVQGRKPGKKESLAPSERKSHDSILDKLNVLRTDPRLKFLMSEDENQLSLEQIIEQLIGSKMGSTVKIIDISGLPNEVAGSLTALIARLLFNYKVWETKDERNTNPILLVCEEAHRYVPNHGEAQYREAQDAIRRVAKEGRKYGLGLMLVSQRPSDVESTVLSQCNSWIIMRLTNFADQEHVARFLPDSLRGLVRILSSLSRREAIFVGEAAALPSRIRILELPPDKLPNSHDVKFADGWSNPPRTLPEIETVTSRWLSLIET